MRGIALILAIASAAAIAASAQGQTARTPTLKVVDRDALVVAGTGFAARERVTITALTSVGPRFVPTRATAQACGRFHKWEPSPVRRLSRPAQPCGFAILW
jgi:hypothetical protein